MTRWFWRVRHGMVSPFLAYLLLALALCSALIPHWGTSIGGVGDAGVYMSDLSRVAWDVFHFRDPLYTHWVFAPGGLSMAMNAQDVVAGVMMTPVTAIFGAVAAYNTALVAVLAADATAMFLLAGEFVESRPARYLAGGLFGFSPYLLAHAMAGHLNLVTVFWLPLLVRVLYRLDRDQVAGKAASLRLALIGAGLIWTDQEITIFAVLLVLLLFGPRLIRHAKPILAGAAGAALLTLPYWLAVIPALHGVSLHSSLWMDQQYAADLGNYLVPGPFTVVGSLSALWHLNLRMGFPYEETEFLGLLLLALPFVIRHAWHRRELRPFLWVLAASLVLSLGPTLHVFGHSTGIPMPYRLLAAVPGLSLLREGARFGLLVTFSLAILAGAWWESWTDRFGDRGQRRALLAAVLLQYLAILPVSWPHAPVRVSLALQAVAKTADGRTVLVLPFGFLAGNAVFTMSGSRAYVYQGGQTQPTGPLPYRLVDGYVSKLPVGVVQDAERNAFLRGLWFAAKGKSGVPPLSVMRAAFWRLAARGRIAAVAVVPGRQAGWRRLVREALTGIPCRTFADGSRLYTMPGRKRGGGA